MVPSSEAAKRRLRRVARRLGFELGRPGGRLLPVGVRPLALPPSVDVGAIRRGHSVSIDIRRLVTPYGFSYADGGWHPYWSTVRAYLAGTATHAESSPLTEYFDRFQPTSANEVLFPGQEVELAALTALAPRDVSVIWTVSARDHRALARQHRSGSGPRAGRPNYNIGPASPDVIRDVFERLVRITKSLQQHGYRPHEFRGGVVEGFFLIAGDDYRFVPTEGQHRLGALRALGFDEVQVMPRYGLTGVRSAQLDRWTRPHGGPYSADEVRLIFERFFEVRPCPWSDVELPRDRQPSRPYAGA